MKNYFNLILIILVYHSEIISPASFNMDINIISSKDKYIVGEPVEIGISVKNTGDQLLELYYPLPGAINVSFNITNINGEILPYRGMISCPISDKKPLQLQPEFETFKLRVLNLDYGRPIGKNFPGYNVLDTGIYIIEVKIIYEGVEYSSNKLSIQVVLPENEQATIYDYMVKVFNELQMNDRESILRTGKELTDFIELNPKSYYSPVILRWLSPVYRFFLNDSKTSDLLRDKFVKEFAWSGLSQEYIDARLKKLTSIESRTEFLLDIKQKSKNSLMEKLIENKLKNI